MQPEVRPATPGEKSPGFGAYFTSKKGKRFYAADYGYKAWPIGKSGKPRKKK
jgi:hypothetical protein